MLLHPQTQAVIVHAKIQNQNGALLPGMYADARIIIDNDKALSVPDDAIVSQGDEHFIFIQEEKNKSLDENIFRKISVAVGSNDLGYTAITPSEGISDKANIVIEGAYSLLSEMNKGGEEE